MKMRRRLTSAARCAIKMRSQEPDISKAVKQLERDLVNGPFHCFNQHANCSPDFCRTARENMQGTSTGDCDSGEDSLDSGDDLQGMYLQ